jgi:hypothetical protein
MKPRARLALCGNVFPASSAAELQASVAGPARAWADAVRARLGPGTLGFGIYLSAAAAAQLRQDAPALARLTTALAAAGLETWTANAFPFGDFHGTEVKQRAFLPDWTSEARLTYTVDVAEVLSQIAPAGARLSLSTCPLGYGFEARGAALARTHLLRARDHLDALARKRGVPIFLALEPEPDGAFERCDDLCSWLAELESDRPPSDRRLALCWDLCHSAVVGEEPAAVMAALDATGTPLGKAQVSAALMRAALMSPAALARLQAFAQDPYLHQVRALAAPGIARAWADLPAFMSDPFALTCSEVRVHCHVPIHHADFGDGLTGTAWRDTVRTLAGRSADMEIETYTLPVLPASIRAGASVPELLAQEYLACREAALLDAS